MLFAKGPNGLVAGPASQRPQQQRQAQQPQQRQVLPQDDGSSAHLRARLAAMEAQNAGLNQRVSKLERAFQALVAKLANRAPRLPAAGTGSVVPEVVERGGVPPQEQRRQERQQSFDDEIEDAIAMSGGDDDELSFG
jgi:hypothetical protein